MSIYTYFHSVVPVYGFMLFIAYFSEPIIKISTSYFIPYTIFMYDAISIGFYIINKNQKKKNKTEKEKKYDRWNKLRLRHLFPLAYSISSYLLRANTHIKLIRIHHLVSGKKSNFIDFSFNFFFCHIFKLPNGSNRYIDRNPYNIFILSYHCYTMLLSFSTHKL